MYVYGNDDDNNRHFIHGYAFLYVYTRGYQLHFVHDKMQNSHIYIYIEKMKKKREWEINKNEKTSRCNITMM